MQTTEEGSNPVFLGRGCGAELRDQKHQGQCLSCSAHKFRNINMKIKFEVINAGFISWGLLEKYFYLKNEGYKYNPDLIILALESTDPDLLNTNQLGFNRSYFKEVNNTNKVFLEEPLILPFKITFVDMLRSKILHNHLYKFSHLQ